MLALRQGKGLEVLRKLEHRLLAELGDVRSRQTKVQALLTKACTATLAARSGLGSHLLGNVKLVAASLRFFVSLLRLFLGLGVDAQALALGAVTHGAVEGERPRLRRGIADPAIRAGELLGH